MTRQDKMAKQIIDLGGNIFKEKPRYRLVIDYPIFKNAKQSLTRDRISGERFNLIHFTNDRWYSMKWISHLDMYLLRELEFIRYEEKLDIKYEWRHRKELKEFYNSIEKASKT